MNHDVLLKEFAYMFQDESGLEPITEFGLETKNGWNNLLFNLLVMITFIDAGKYVRVRQIKQKFGSLRFYVEWTGNPPYKKQISDIITLFEIVSERVCEECGEPGKIRYDSYISTLCDKCHSIKYEHERAAVTAQSLFDEELLCSGHLQPRDL